MDASDRFEHYMAHLAMDWDMQIGTPGCGATARG